MSALDVMAVLERMRKRSSHTLSATDHGLSNYIGKQMDAEHDALAAVRELVAAARHGLACILDEAEKRGYEPPADTGVVCELETALAAFPEQQS